MSYCHKEFFFTDKTCQICINTIANTVKARWYEIKALNLLTAEMRVYGVISKDDVNAKDFINSLRELESKYPNIDVRLNCEGGNVFEGFAMYNAMKQSKATINTFNDGICASMGSILLQGATGKRIAARNSRVMTHLPSGAAQGSAKDLRSIAEVMDSLAADMRTVYKNASKKDDATIDTWMQEGVDKWFTAQEAKDANLVDEVIDPIADIDEASLVGLTSFAIVAKFTEKLNHTKNHMDRNLLITALGLPANATDADILAALQSIVAKVKTLETNNTALNTEIAAFKKESIEALMTEANIDAAMKPVYTALADKDFNSTKQILAGMKAEVKPQAQPHTLPSSVILGKGGVPTATPDVRANWKFSEWMEKAPADLEKLEKTDPAKFRALYMGEFNGEPDLSK